MSQTAGPRPRVAAFSALMLLFCSAPASVPGPQASQPTLLVLITVDQLRPDYLDRYKSQFTGGLARFVTRGAFFTEAYQDHAITETAPGHASLLSGRFPRSTGITRNILGVGDADHPLLGSTDFSASPRRFRGTTLTDWLLAKNPRTKVLSVSMKDRGAILPIGRSKQQVYWFPSNGIFTTSTYYRDSLPGWVQDFNNRQEPERFTGKTWTLLLPEKDYAEPDSVPLESFGRDFQFPHPLPTGSLVIPSAIRAYPMMDQITLDFALEGLNRLDLGRGSSPDLLAISLSTTDLVGHRFGPDSREIHDQIVRLDRYLGAFMDSLYKVRDSTRIIFVLSADHGTQSMPEISAARGVRPVPLRVPPGLLTAAALDFLRSKGADTTAIEFESGAFFVDSTRLKGVSVDDVVSAFAKGAKQVNGVLRVDRWADLPKHDLTKDAIARRWLNMFPTDLAPNAVATLTVGSIWSYGLPSTHGSPHDADAHVPIVFMGAPFKPGRYPQFVRTIDVAPTLAQVLGVAPSEPLDGRPLTAAIR